MEIRFGTDGWRGLMARDFTFDNVRRVAQAVANHMKGQMTKPTPKPSAVVAYDRRFQSDAYALEISRVLASNGVRVTLCSDPLPTPALSLLTKKLKTFGIMVTASHNPAAYNGIKIRIDGRAAADSITGAIESCLDRANPMRNGADKFLRKSFRKEYLDFLRGRANPSRFAGRLSKPVVLDYMHGASSGMMRELLKSGRLVEMRSTHDPLFGGTHPEPIEANLGALKERVLKEKALIGIAIDGDGDRIGVVDDKGRYMTPCQVYPMMLEYLISQRGIKGKIVQSVSLGYLSGRVAQAHGLPFEELPVGFKHVGEALACGQAVIGAEESGGYSWKGNLPERDGLLSALLLLEMCALSRKTPSELWGAVEAKYGRSSFRRVDFRLHRAAVDKAVFTAKVAKRLPKKLAGSAVKSMTDIDGVKIVLEGGHWLLLRPSGTEPVIRTYTETDSAKRTQELLDAGAKWIHAQL